ncbi:HCP-like protein [Rhizophagus irregularis]|uniref:HCP-like protein n=1 Tax=Rhizophagus irregularis TaxID=588596 RepID=A0A2I1HIV6_9GLOM|nr:HCP-like protein [Rhizophagus irregularis]
MSHVLKISYLIQQKIICWSVMEYADSGTLRDYLKNNFHGLTWNNKYNLAYRIDEASKSQSKLFGMVPYIDPKVFILNGKKLDEKSDVYSIGVLLWEISSGKPPFYEEKYDFSLMYKISQGRREITVPNTPNDYSNLYTECWNNEPSKRPTIHEAVNKLSVFISNSDSITIYQQNDLEVDKIFINEQINENITSEINGIVDFIFEEVNKDHMKVKRHESIFFLGYFNYTEIETTKDKEKAYNLFINASEKNYILAQYYVGECYRFGSGITKNQKLIKFASGQMKLTANNENLKVMHNPVHLYINGDSVDKNNQRAFELFKQSAEGEFSGGIATLAYCYSNGIGINIDKQKVIELQRKAANLGDMMAKFILAVMYEKGDGIKKDLNKAIYWYEQSAKQGHQKAQKRLKELKKN